MKLTEEQYAELAQFWHEFMVLGPRREDIGLDRTGRALMFCQWIDSDPDEDPVYGLPDILAFFDEKERREGTAGPLETMSEETRAERQEEQESKCDRCGKEGVALFDLTPAAAPPGVTIYVCNDCYRDEARELEDDGYDLDLPPDGWSDKLAERGY